MPWYVWLTLAGFGLASIICFVRSYRHLRPDAKRQAVRLTLRGPLIRQNLFTGRGFQLRLFGWILACCAMGVLVVWGLIEECCR
jgi:hypothetical protein